MAQQYSTPALEEGGWSVPYPSHFMPVKETHYPLYTRLGHRTGLDRSGNFCPQRGSNPRLSSPQQVCIPTTLTWPLTNEASCENILTQALNMWHSAPKFMPGLLTNMQKLNCVKAFQDLQENHQKYTTHFKGHQR
jgi:hypothetical protein